MEGIVKIFYTLGWRYCLSPPHRSLPFFRLFGIHLAGNSINYFTPTATLGGEVIKGTLLSRSHRGPEAATGVIIGKLAYALSQLLFVVLGSILILWRIRLPVAGSIAMLTGTILLGAGIVGFLVVQKHGKLGAVVRWLVAHKVGGETLRKGGPANYPGGSSPQTLLSRASGRSASGHVLAHGGHGLQHRENLVFSPAVNGWIFFFGRGNLVFGDLV